MSNTTRIWLHSLIAAAVSGAGNGISVMIVSPADFNLQSGLGKLLQVFVVGAIVGLALFLKQSPLPPAE
jgi:hypothetical protein